MLKYIGEHSGADPQKPVRAAEILENPKPTGIHPGHAEECYRQARTVLNQLRDECLVKIEHEDSRGNAFVFITMPGIWEVEALDKQPDIVEQFTSTLRKHPIGGWSVLAFLGLGLLATFVNQIIGIIKAIQ